MKKCSSEINQFELADPVQVILDKNDCYATTQIPISNSKAGE